MLLQSGQVPINPYGKAKKMAEDIILDYVKSNTQLAVMILRCVEFPWSYLIGTRSGSLFEEESSMSCPKSATEGVFTHNYASGCGCDLGVLLTTTTLSFFFFDFLFFVS